MLDGTEAATGLRAMRGETVVLDHEDLTRRDLILAIGIDGLDHTRAVRECDDRHVIVHDRVASSLCSKRMLDSFSIEGAIRVLPLHRNSPDDIARFLEKTADIRRSVGRTGPP